jgi:hypothetical protein
MRRLLLLLGAIVLLAALALPEFVYPVRVTFKFDYDGHHYDLNYLTLMRIGLCHHEESFSCWEPGRDRLVVPLADGSQVILRPEWPFAGQKFQSGKEYASQGRWMWLNKPKEPTQIVYADGAAKLSPDRSDRPPFTWIVVNATIERISELSLIQALSADGQPDGSVDVLNSQLFGVRRADTGYLFGGIEVIPLQGEGLVHIKKLAEWVDLPDGCRIHARRVVHELPPNTELVSEPSQRRMLLRHDGLWSDDGAPRVGEVFVVYPAGRPQPSGGVPFYVRSVLQEVKSLEFEGRKCTGIRLPADSFGAFVDWGDGRIVSFGPSLGFVVLRD